MSKENTINDLKVVLADNYVLYLKTQNYHWNIEGPQFREIHLLLEEQYTDLATAIDNIAELIRMLGAKAPGKWSTYSQLTSLSEGNEEADAKTMLSDLLADQKIIMNSLSIALQSAQKIEDEAVAGLLTDRLLVHKKNHWMLESMLK